MKGVQRGATLYWRDEIGDVFTVLVLDKGPGLRWWVKLSGGAVLAVPARELYETASLAVKR